jgi:hypothetical protein
VKTWSRKSEKPGTVTPLLPKTKITKKNNKILCAKIFYIVLIFNLLISIYYELSVFME